MHDPDVVAFEIRRPWPKRDRSWDSERTGRPRWRLRGPFWILAGRGLYWPYMITFWHREPGGRDSGEVCKHYIRWRGDDGKWQSKMLRGWRWQVHHWRIQVGPLQTLRRWALTRCAWCDGRSRKGDHVNTSHQWDSPRGRWWQGEPGLFHRDCSAIAAAHRSCVCAKPGRLKHGDHGECSRCGRFLEFGRKPLTTDTHRLLQTIPAGRRDPEVYAEVCRRWATAREDVSTP